MGEKRLLAKFVIVGGTGFLANYAILHTLTQNFDYGKVVAEIIAAVVALQITFLLHDRWTYRRDSVEFDIKLWGRYTGYLITNSFGSLITIVLFSVISYLLIDILALGLAAAIAMVWNYLINKLVIWRNHTKV